MDSPVADVLARMERRFITASFIPVVVLAAAYAVTLALAIDPTRSLLDQWRDLSLSEQALLATSLLTISWFAASLIHANWRKIVRLYEGYPIKWLFARVFPGLGHTEAWSRVPGVTWHLERQQQHAGPAMLYSRYPSREHALETTLPTTVGNILLSSEQYALTRYGIDLNLLWPRLYWQLPEDVQSSIEVFKEEYQVPLALSFVSFLFGFCAGATVLICHGDWVLFLVVASVSFGLSIGSYLLAIERVEEYGEQLRTAVDLYRQRLPAAWPTGPRRHKSEQQYFAAAFAFIQHGIQLPTGMPDPRMPANQSDALHSMNPSSPGWTRWAKSWPLRVVVRAIRPHRLLTTTAAVLFVWTTTGTLFLMLTPTGGEQAQSVLITLPVAPPLLPGEDLAVGQTVDLAIKPCGRKIDEATVMRSERVTTSLTATSSTSVPSTTGSDTTLYVTFRMDDSKANMLDGCALESASVIRKG